MLENIYKDQTTLLRLREGPISEYIETIAEYYINNGYTPKQLKTSFSTISHFNRWLIQDKIPLDSLNEKEIEKYVLKRKSKTRSVTCSGAQHAFTLLVELLRKESVIPKPFSIDVSIDSVTNKLASYKHYLVEDKGFSPSSIKRYAQGVNGFLHSIPSVTLGDFNQLSVDDVLSYISDFAKSHSSKNTQCVVSIVRDYLRYLFAQGLIDRDLSKTLPASPSNRAGNLPEYLTKQQCNKLLNSCHRDTAVGLRNYAILLVLLRLGLRASELINLTLNDIDWQIGEIRIRGKGNLESKIPLFQELGNALVTYLKSGRPKTHSQHLFVGSRAPHRKFSNPSSISTLVRRALHNAGIETQLKGAHLLRYTTAHEGINNGATLFEIASLLRHTSIDMTAKYIKIDIKHLQQIAQPWPHLTTGGEK